VPIYNPGSTGSGAPSDATYVTQTPSVSLPNSQALSALATGLLKVTTATGVLSVATASDLPAHNLLSAQHGDTLTASVVRGDLIIGNSTPKWSRLAIGAANTVLKSDGTDVSWVTSTGTGSNVLATSPTLVTPVLGVATCTSLNGNTFTTGTYTLTGVAGKTLTFNKSLTLDGTDATTMTFPTTSATIARTDAAQTFTGTQTFGGTGSLFDSNGLWIGGYANTVYTITTPTLRLDVANQDVFVKRGGAANLQLGVDLNGAAISQTLSACNGITGTDKTGGNLTLASGKGTGAGAVSSLIFQTPAVLSTGTTAQSLVTRLTLTEASAVLATALTVPAGSVAAPSINFTGATTSGFSYASGVQFSIGGASKMTFGTSWLALDPGHTLGWTSGAPNATGFDLQLLRDAADVLAQRRGANAQTYRLYGTYTDTSNYERLVTRAVAAADFELFPEAAGTGTLRGLKIGTSAGKLGFYGTTAIAQAVLATGAGATVDNVITALQNLGLVKQS
jgi:hypothetical protein